MPVCCFHSPRVRLRYEEVVCDLVVCASRQPLHWAAPSGPLIACRSSAFRKPLMWWMKKRHRAAANCVSPQSSYCQHKPGQAKTNRRNANKSLSYMQRVRLQSGGTADNDFTLWADHIISILFIYYLVTYTISGLIWGSWGHEVDPF